MIFVPKDHDVDEVAEITSGVISRDIHGATNMLSVMAAVLKISVRQ